MNATPNVGGFFGRTAKRYQAGGFTLSESRYAPGAQLPWHSHQVNYIGLVLEGTYHETYGGRERRCDRLMVVSHPAGERHAQRFASAVRLFRIEVDRADPCPAREFRGSEVTSIALRLHREFQAIDSVTSLAVEGLGLELIAAMARHSPLLARPGRGRSQPWLADARDFIKSRFRDRTALDEMARAVGVHPVTLSREFRRHYGATITDAIRAERIAFASRQLIESDASVSDIAIDAGFYDQSHFTRTFKRLMRVTPADYRRAGRR